MNEVQVGRYSQLLHKLLEMSEGAPTPVIAPELFAFLGLEIDRPEWEYLKGGKLATGYVIEAASAGARSIAALVNPQGSGVLCVVKMMMWYSATDETIIDTGMASTVFNAFDSDGTARPRDVRMGAVNPGFSLRPTCLVMSDTRAVLSAPISRHWPQALMATSRVFRDMTPYVLPPNSGIALTPSSDNVAMSARFVWTERAIQPMELQGVNPRFS